MSSPPKDNKLITNQTRLNDLFREFGGPAFLNGCEELVVRSDSFTPEFHDTIRKEHLEYRRDSVLVCVAFRYTRMDGTVRFSPKMLLVDDIRHCC
jgi:hypothetical protein